MVKRKKWGEILGVNKTDRKTHLLQPPSLVLGFSEVHIDFLQKSQDKKGNEGYKVQYKYTQGLFKLVSEVPSNLEVFLGRAEQTQTSKKFGRRKK